MENISILPVSIGVLLVLMFCIFLYKEIKMKQRGMKEKQPNPYARDSQIRRRDRNIGSITFEDEYLEKLYHMHEEKLITTREYDRRVHEYRKNEKQRNI